MVLRKGERPSGQSRGAGARRVCVINGVSEGAVNSVNRTASGMCNKAWGCWVATLGLRLLSNAGVCKKNGLSGGEIRERKSGESQHEDGAVSGCEVQLERAEAQFKPKGCLQCDTKAMSWKKWVEYIGTRKGGGLIK